jgi:hypothetical protein
MLFHSNERRNRIVMNGSRGALYSHKLFNLANLGLKDSGVFVDRIIREFLKIGEAVAARWIQMPHGILILQMVPGRSDSGAIYLYDRQQQAFYLLGFDGPDDHLTIEEFEHLMVEYGLLLFAEQPDLAHATHSSLLTLEEAVAKPSVFTTRRCRTFHQRWQIGHAGQA